MMSLTAHRLMYNSLPLAFKPWVHRSSLNTYTFDEGNANGDTNGWHASGADAYLVPTRNRLLFLAVRFKLSVMEQVLRPSNAETCK
jgi:hypothetical protein